MLLHAIYPSINSINRSLRQRNVRAILFDAGNTLLRIDYPAIAKKLTSFGFQCTEHDVVISEYKARVRLDLLLSSGNWGKAGLVAGHYFQYLLEELNVTDENIYSMMASWRRSYNLPIGIWNQPAPDAEEVLQDLRRCNVITGVISNSNGTINSVLSKLGLAKHLDIILDSHTVGIEKPDARIFQLALQQTKLAPENVLYVGDLYSIDILGARAAGINGILLDPGGVWKINHTLMSSNLRAAICLAATGSI